MFLDLNPSGTWVAFFAPIMRKAQRTRSLKRTVTIKLGSPNYPKKKIVEKLEGKIALITGGNCGIGRGMSVRSIKRIGGENRGNG
jgi:hypothetical protein